MKASEIRDLTLDEMQQQLQDSEEELFNLRFQQSMNRLENADRIKGVRKDIARLKTIITEKEKDIR